MTLEEQNIIFPNEYTLQLASIVGVKMSKARAHHDPDDLEARPCFSLFHLYNEVNITPAHVNVT